MAVNSKTTFYVACIYIFSLVSALPAPAEVAASISTTGAKVATDAVTTAAANAAKTATDAATTATNAAKVATDVAGKIDVSTATQAASSGLDAAISTGNKISGTTSGVVGTAASKATSALSTAENLKAGAASAVQGTLSSGLGLVSAQSNLASALRNGIVEFVNLADRGTGQLSSGFRAGLNGGGGIVDGGLRIIGIQQPVVTPATDAMWSIGESGRRTGFNVVRQGVDGSFSFFDPSIGTRPIAGALTGVRVPGTSVAGSGTGTTVATSA